MSEITPNELGNKIPSAIAYRDKRLKRLKAGKNEDSDLNMASSTITSFNNLIVKIGNSIAKAQEIIDLNQVEFQRNLVKSIQENKRFENIPSTSFIIPETNLDLKVALSIKQEEEGTTSFYTLPLNAKTINENNINLDTATEVKLKFVSIPQVQSPPSTEPSNYQQNIINDFSQNNENLKSLLLERVYSIKDIYFDEDSRIWFVTYFNIQNLVFLVILDDGTGKILGVFDTTDKLNSDTDTDTDLLKDIKEPEISEARNERTDEITTSTTLISAQFGDIIEVTGNNLLTLAKGTSLIIDDINVPILTLKLKSLRFKVPEWAFSGSIQIVTPKGSAKKNKLLIQPTIDKFEPHIGYFDYKTKHGTLLSIFGKNFKQNMNYIVNFGGNISTDVVEWIAYDELLVEVPINAQSGPLTLIIGDNNYVMPDLFYILPRIDRIRPRQGSIGDEISVAGNSLENVLEIQIGKATLKRSDFKVQSTDIITFDLPFKSSNGNFLFKIPSVGDETGNIVKSSDIFYVIPKITGYEHDIVRQGDIITIIGTGMEAEADKMTLIFESLKGTSEASILYVSPDRKSLTTKVPDDAVTGFPFLLSKRIFSSDQEDTHKLNREKLLILTKSGSSTDFIMKEFFKDKQPLDNWALDKSTGSWEIINGYLTLNEIDNDVNYSKLNIKGPENYFGNSVTSLSFYIEVSNTNSIGFSFKIHPSNPPPPAEPENYNINLWIELDLQRLKVETQSADSPVVDYKPIKDKVIDKEGNYLVLLEIISNSEGDGSLDFNIYLNQKLTISFNEPNGYIVDFALLGKELTQKWDNLIILKESYLSLSPPELYRFGNIPYVPKSISEPSKVEEQKIEAPIFEFDNFIPKKGKPGSKIKIYGSGFDDATKFYLNGVEAKKTDDDSIEPSSDDEIPPLAIIVVPDGALSGYIEIRGRDNQILTSKSINGEIFTVAPTIQQISPINVLTGENIVIIGTNFPLEKDKVIINILDTVLTKDELEGIDLDENKDYTELTNPSLVIENITPTRIIVKAPNKQTKGKIMLQTSSNFLIGYREEINIRTEEEIVDFINIANKLDWMIGKEKVTIGDPPTTTKEYSVQIRKNTMMEDGKTYPKILFIHPPRKPRGLLEGKLVIDDDTNKELASGLKGHLKLVIEHGMLYSAKPIFGGLLSILGFIEDGITIALSFIEKGTNRRYIILKPQRSMFNGTIDRAIIDLNKLGIQIPSNEDEKQGLQGTFVFTISSGMYDFHDDAGIINARIIRVSG